MKAKTYIDYSISSYEINAEDNLMPRRIYKTVFLQKLINIIERSTFINHFGFIATEKEKRKSIIFTTGFSLDHKRL